METTFSDISSEKHFRNECLSLRPTNAEQLTESASPGDDSEEGAEPVDSADDDEWNAQLPADDAHWDAFLADDDELDPLPQPGDFWFNDA